MPEPQQQQGGLPGADAVDQMAGEQPGQGGGGSPQTQVDNQPQAQTQGAPAPQGTVDNNAQPEDPDEDGKFWRENPEKNLSPGMVARIKRLQEQRDAERKRIKETQEGYKFFEPYKDPKGQQYLKSLVDFDGHLDKSLQEKAYLRPLLQELLAQGREPNWKNLQKIIAEHAQEDAAAGAEAKVVDPLEGEDPLAQKVAELDKKYAGWEKQQREKEEAVRFEQTKNSVKSEMQGQIEEFKTAHPEYAGNNKFIAAGIRSAMAAGVDVKQALEELAGVFGDIHKGRLQKAAKNDQAAAGADVLRNGRAGTTIKEMPKIGSDEQRKAMLEMYGVDPS